MPFQKITFINCYLFYDEIMCNNNVKILKRNNCHVIFVTLTLCAFPLTMNKYSIYT